MPLQHTLSGVQIQALEEILSEYETSIRGTYGNQSFKVGAGSVTGKLVGVNSEREALLQQLIQDTTTVFDPTNATGVLLDILCAITNTVRKGTSKSKSENFLGKGVPGTSIEDGRRFQNNSTKEFWTVVDGPFVIGALSEIPVTAQADETGPTTFVTSGASEWSITLGEVGWTTIEAAADIDPEDIGQDVESHEALRERRKDELLVNGNDLDGIRALVLRVKGVTDVRVEHNQSCTVVSPEGIPPGAFEVVVEGGDDTNIAQSIYTGLPPGAEAFGTVQTVITTSSGDPVTIGHTRPLDVDYFILVTCTTTGAKGTLPPNPEQIVLDAVLAYGNANFNESGTDIIPQAFFGTIFTALRDEQGKDSITSVVIQFSKDNGAGVAPAFPPTFPPPGTGIDIYTSDVRVITLRERADFDSARIGVTIT